MENLSIFVDPEKLESVIREIENCGLLITGQEAGGPEALIHFKGSKKSLEYFLEYNSFEITEDQIM